MANWDWKPIRNCPGRFVLVGGRSDISPEVILGHASQLTEFKVKAARDTVVVARIDGGGLISYKRPDGTYVHTLADTHGFSRKMEQLGIVPGNTSADLFEHPG